MPTKPPLIMMQTVKVDPQTSLKYLSQNGPTEAADRLLSWMESTARSAWLIHHDPERHHSLARAGKEQEDLARDRSQRAQPDFPPETPKTMRRRP